jgi:hypothetical protein
MRARRLRTWLSGFSWWALSTLAACLAAIVLAVRHRPLSEVIAVGLVAVSLAVLSTRENT